MLTRSHLLDYSISLSLLLVTATPGLGADEAPAAKLPPASKKQVDFVRDIKPLFAARCYECHGKKMQESGLRLDRKQNAFQGGDSGVIIVPKKSAESRLVHFVAGLDPDEIMPPEGDPLSRDEVGLIRAWIDQGAVWPASADKAPQDIRRTHWAYQPIRRPTEPELPKNNWVRNPIDTFVFARLQQKNIEPSSPADRHTLIRRLSLDLLGLPPTPAEVESFVTDSSSSAYEALVDRLLRSPHFGERWGRHWLDVARYADSDGYEKDRPRPNAWRWRNWVIDAVNRDMPFDQFTIEQLAGDLLPDATSDQKLATAFHRQTLTNTEGGTDQEQWRVEAVFDRVETTGTAWLGLTLVCARCHTHKYDPITQREYYQLFAFLNNGDETNTDVPISEQEVARYGREKAEWDRALEALDAKIGAARSKIGPALENWEAGVRAELATLTADSVQFHPLDFTIVEGAPGVTFERDDQGSYLVSGKNGDRATYTLKAKTELTGITGFRLEALAAEALPSQGPGRAGNGNFVLNRFTVESSSTEDFKEPRAIKFETARTDYTQDGFAATHVIDGNKKTGWAVGGGTGKDHQLVAFISRSKPLNQPGWLRITLDQQHGTQHTLGRFRVTAVTGIDGDHIAPSPIRAILAIASEQRTAAQREALIDHYARIDAELSKLMTQRDTLRAKPPKSPNMTVRVVSQRANNPRSTHMFKRGDFLRPLNEVQPGTPEILHSIEVRTTEQGDRLDLARWLIATSNPLTPRVAVNRIWLHLFGAGLAPIINDFGVRGEKPTHPELLDWLATEYIRLGWSRKQMIKQIVMSSTYQQSSSVRPELAESDPQNYLLARQNRFRVEAEIIRDAALAAAGLLSPKIGGPSVFPPMPADVAELSYANNFKWNTSKNEDRYRRGMYTFFKRTAPHPNLVTFDCPDANTTCVARRSSNTPLQALTTLNNEVFLEASQGLAHRALAEKIQSDSERVAFAFRLCVARPPAALESERLLDLLGASRAWYRDRAEESKLLAGNSPLEGVSAAEVAAWVATVRIIMNLDEFITRE